MNIMELGAIGELVGGLAVLVTLIYLAIQVRQGNQIERQEARLARATAQRDGLHAWVRSTESWAANPDEIPVLQRGFADFASMSNRDQVFFHLHAAPPLSHLASAIAMEEEGLESEENVGRYSRFCLAMIATPGGRQWWEIVKPTAPPSSVAYLEGRLIQEESASPPLTEVLPFYAPDELAR